MMEEGGSTKNMDEINEEVELSLDLSIGTKTYTKSNIILGTTPTCCPKILATQQQQQQQQQQATPKREVQAMRRQEARKRREERLKINNMINIIAARGGGGKCKGNSVNNDVDIDVDINEEEEEGEQPPCKKEKNGKGVENDDGQESVVVKDLDLTLNNSNNDNGAGLMGLEQMVYATPANLHLQYNNNNNILGMRPFTMYSYGVTPDNDRLNEKKKRGISSLCNGIDVGGNHEDKEKNVSFKATGSFRPYDRNNSNFNNYFKNGNAKLDASSGASSSALSVHHNSSLQGGGNSSDTGSSAGKFSQENLNASSTGNQREEKSENNSGSNGMKSIKVEEKTVTNHKANKVSLGMHNSDEANCSEEPKSNIQQADPHCQPTTSNGGLNASNQLNEDASNGVIDKTPIPQPENHNASSLPQMPCVSTTGNGPNGKTITGFLYRYTKTEVSIVCVCHGTSFSPSEFVEHAGGIDVAHPLRHITVIPSAFA